MRKHSTYQIYLVLSSTLNPEMLMYLLLLAIFHHQWLKTAGKIPIFFHIHHLK
jgi:hypothetical protein